MTPEPAAGILAELIGLGGAGLAVTEFERGGAATAVGAGAGVVQIGVHRGGAVPGGALEAFDILLSTDPAAPGPWVGVPAGQMDATLAELAAAVAAQPVAAAVAAQVLRASLQVSFDQALVAESLAYSMLLGAAGFQAWRAATPVRARVDDGPRVLIAEARGGLEIRLNRPSARNAFDARMRDELAEALAFAAEHPDAPPVVLTGAGPAFSAGGDLDEFGRAGDPGQAHLIRTLRAPARLVRALGARLTAQLHGACVGAGIEVPAAAARVTARPGAVFRLPEVSMGLLPGAGGTATIPRRIGRRRACYMAISGADIDLRTALVWGLVDAVAQ
ncbi:enoyl-CoA hydratase/isomerase family protein [Phenylobacterium sp.]|uniref:enoyl-CoA hydratase/isomerase family protein n=1 Tax=Phenylobacterium sp. TaxID=1871053 RepID=UPI0025CD6DD2|nr:enoyl-CoA hydratase/isomerase family protein [Phenylobacterium sp.]